MTAHPIYVGGQPHMPLSDFHAEKMRLRRRRRLVGRIQRVGLIGTALFSAWMLWAARADAQEVTYNAADARLAIAEAADTYGVSEAWLLATARCEAPGLNPYAVGRQGELGLAQLHPRGELRRFYALGYLNPFSPYEAMDFMAMRFAAGGSRAWSCS